ncbi:MAG: T9SS type A sorting domain-containing protein [Saprospiraceae bacterium]|nr:T9SS type A sorting domain-containing protein [Saprospiraceae bacterium]
MKKTYNLSIFLFVISLINVLHSQSTVLRQNEGQSIKDIEKSSTSVYVFGSTAHLASPGTFDYDIQITTCDNDLDPDVNTLVIDDLSGGMDPRTMALGYYDESIGKHEGFAFSAITINTPLKAYLGHFSNSTNNVDWAYKSISWTNYTGSKCIALDNGDYIFFHNSYSFDESIYRIIISRISANGIIVWQKVLRLSNANGDPMTSVATDICEITNDKFAITGFGYFTVSGTDYMSGFLAVIDENANIEWVKQIKNNQPLCVKRSSFNSKLIYVCGRSVDEKLFVASFNPANGNVNDYVAVIVSEPISGDIQNIFPKQIDIADNDGEHVGIVGYNIKFVTYEPIYIQFNPVTNTYLNYVVNENLGQQGGAIESNGSTFYYGLDIWADLGLAPLLGSDVEIRHIKTNGDIIYCRGFIDNYIYTHSYLSEVEDLNSSLNDIIDLEPISLSSKYSELSYDKCPPVVAPLKKQVEDKNLVLRYASDQQILFINNNSHEQTRNLQIVDLMGKVHFVKIIKSSFDKIDTSCLIPGIYFAIETDKSNKSPYKFIVE